MLIRMEESFMIAMNSGKEKSLTVNILQINGNNEKRRMNPIRGIRSIIFDQYTPEPFPMLL